VPSQYFKVYVSKKYSIDEKMISIYPSTGVDTELFKELSKEDVVELKKQYFVDNGKATFCYVGRITANKGWDTFLRAVSILRKRGTSANYIFVGDGLEKDQYNSLVEELELEKEIKKYSLLPQKELVSIYNISDAFVFPTRREGESLGLVAIEAMACGTPVISCDFAAPKYYVQDDYNGYKFRVNDADQLANIMESFVSGKHMKEKLILGCIETAQEYESKSILKKLRDIFEV